MKPSMAWSAVRRKGLFLEHDLIWSLRAASMTLMKGDNGRRVTPSLSRPDKGR